VSAPPRCWRSVAALVAALLLLRGAIGIAAEPVPALRVGTTGDYPPFSFREGQGELSGFDITVARRLAEDLGRPVEFVALRWPELVMQVEGGTVALVMSGVTVRPDRALRIAFTRPYILSGAVVVLRAAERRKYARLQDLDRPTVRLAVNAGGHLEQVARQRFVRARLIPVSDNRSLPDLLRQGEVDAVLSEQYEASAWPANDFVTLGPLTRDRKAYALALGARGLARQVNDWLAAREADGWLNQQRRRWLGARAVMGVSQSACEAMVAAIDLRLQLMPFVAAVKRRDGLPIDDPAQEARVLDQVRAAAAAERLNPDDVAELFRAQMDVAKAVQRTAPLEPLPSTLSLAQVREAVAVVSDRVLAELSRFQPWAHTPAQRAQLDGALRRGLTVQRVPASMRDRLGRAVLRVRPAR